MRKTIAALLTVSALMTGHAFALEGTPVRKPISSATIRLDWLAGDFLEASVKAIELEHEEILTTSEVEESIYSQTDALMMEYVIQNECRGANLEHKIAVAQLILNRVQSPMFPNTIYEVLHQKGQFTAIQNYYEHWYEPDETTKEAVRQVLSGQAGDLINGAVFYYSPSNEMGAKVRQWFESLTPCAEISQELYGVTYRHVFLK